MSDAPVYQNNREGFRFLVPDNWTQDASTMLPRGPLDKEELLTRYRMRTAGPGASLEVLCFDLPKGDVMLYYPEANQLIGLDTDPRSHTPAFKSVAVGIAIHE